MASSDIYQPPSSITSDDESRYKKVVQAVAKTWQQELFSLGHIKPGTEKAYDEIGDEFAERVRMHPEQAPHFSDSNAVDDGIMVISRFMYAGALVQARNPESTVSDVVGLMDDSQSIRNLFHLTRERKKAANDIEIANGLVRFPFSHIDNEPNRYDIGKTGGLEMINFEKDRRMARRHLLESNELTETEALSTDVAQNPVRCQGSRLIPATYRAMLHICSQDSRLFAATLKRHQ